MPEPSRSPIRALYLEPQDQSIERLQAALDLSLQQRDHIQLKTVALVEAVRTRDDPGVMQSFLAEYGLSTEEGVALMCLAEALLRVPDDETIDELIQDKIVPHDWASHIGDSGSILVNASTWALMLTGRVLEDESEGVVGALRGVMKRLGEPVIRLAVERAMREMGEQFVLGQDIGEATSNGNALVAQGYTYSYDMLGEAAVTEPDAQRYLDAYAAAIDALAERAHSDDLRENPGISVKLSALHPRYHATHRSVMLEQLHERLLMLAQKAKAAGIGLNIDAEEADRLDLSLDVIKSVLADGSLGGWDGFGIVVQAYGPRALPVIEWLYQIAEHTDRKIMVRLVKGAYWDTEIKRAQVMGLNGYPVYTRKSVTDLSYLACAQRLLQMTDRIYPQFATHNAHTVSAVLAMAGSDKNCFEFQRLHGMGDALHDIVRQEYETRCRIYAPVGTHEDLLAYLVRRLLENGANSSFVNQIVDLDISPEEIASDPVMAVAELSESGLASLVMPSNIFLPERVNSQGWDITDPARLESLERAMSAFLSPKQWMPDESSLGGIERVVVNPANSQEVVGRVVQAAPEDISAAIQAAVGAASFWSSKDVSLRAQVLSRAADLYEKNAPEIFALLMREAGKTREDAIAEIREAVDFLRYYSTRASEVETDTEARGCIVCISPWNFPLAIFTGQIAAALATGNTVLAKPAEQTPLIALLAVSLLHEAGVPREVLQVLPGEGVDVGAALVASTDIAGVCFTGSTAVAGMIDRQLAITAPADAMLIAETGGLNAMIVDSTALLEQAVLDIVQSAFQSAGQRCSALRVVYVQEEISERLLTMLRGAMDELQVGDPLRLETDVGPIIDKEAKENIQHYCDQMASEGRILHQVTMTPTEGFVAPTVIKVSGIEQMEQEIFGPVLHFATFASTEIESVVRAVNQSHYGLTFGLHTRIDQRVQEIVDQTQVGNFYVNRNQIGAAVGSQPFGGEGLSGTGPKAGGPHYLRRFRKRSTNQKAFPHSGHKETLVQVTESEFHQCLKRINGCPTAEPEQQLTWLRSRLRGRAAEALADSAALDCGPIDLPGPTGESNQLLLVPLGTVICVSQDADRLLEMVVQALRMGNRVLAAGVGVKKSLRCIKACPQLQILESDIQPAWLSTGEFQGIAADQSVRLSAIRQVLSQREGAIMRLITERHYAAAYGVERALCIDTTAAGGNAALLAETV
ncbi:MAG: bifunctional proline dehydrogenase/L-glutamate gamma-semialdehyde dehydrogenase PutA [Acidiferrobacterales bacterium]|nr:bifunctional proline dehydrogenase/L-glutamate gamma-semialdehyde dehydrogenase PutA [Acidiferrobacterales bacterium]